MSDDPPKSINFNRQYITIAIWIVLFFATMTGSARLSDSIESAQGFLDEGTESGKGTLVYEERYNVTGDVSHIIVMHITDDSNEKITSNSSKQFSYALAVYLNDSLVTQEGFEYDRFSSQALLLLSPIPGIEEFANSLVSEDEKLD